MRQHQAYMRKIKSKCNSGQLQIKVVNERLLLYCYIFDIDTTNKVWIVLILSSTILK